MTLYRDPEKRLLARLLRSRGGTMASVFEHFEKVGVGGMWYKKQPRFHYRVGLYLKRPCEAIISSKGRFVVLRFIPSERYAKLSTGWHRLKDINPKDPDSCLYSGRASPWGPMYNFNYNLALRNPRSMGVINLDAVT